VYYRIQTGKGVRRQSTGETGNNLEKRIILDQRGKDGTHVGLIQEVFVICGLETEPKAPPPVPAERGLKPGRPDPRVGLGSNEGDMPGTEFAVESESKLQGCELFADGTIHELAAWGR
jgi:hypothetical protein